MAESATPVGEKTRAIGDARQPVASALQELAARFRRFAAGPDFDARELRAACAWGGKLLMRASEAGILPIELPKPEPPNRASDDDSGQYRLLWLSGLSVFSTRLPRDFPSNPHGTIWERRESPDAESVAVSVGCSANTRTLAENYAVVCDALVELIATEDALQTGLQQQPASVPAPPPIASGTRAIGDARQQEPPAAVSQAEQYVTLLQMSAIVNRSKRTLENNLGKLPAPEVKGGKGKPNEWRWSVIRPILEQEYGRTLPAAFPADRFTH